MVLVTARPVPESGISMFGSELRAPAAGVVMQNNTNILNVLV
jgi:hypothetical protein